MCKLYVGNLPPSVNEQYLHHLFNLESSADLIESVKLITQTSGNNYAFIEYRDPYHAEHARKLLHGKRVFNNDIRVNWALTNGTSVTKEDLSTHSHVFVGDLGTDVSDQLLGQAFGAFGSLSEARVMWDPNSGRSRGYGFVAFKERADAERAIAAMNNQWLGSRCVRVNWANQKIQNNHIISNKNNGMNAIEGGVMKETATTVEDVMAQSPIYNTTVYIGNLSPQTTDLDVMPLFLQFGTVCEIRLQVDKGFGFIKLDTHENAATAILSLNGYVLFNRQLKCSWGKERFPDMNGFHPLHMQNFVYPQQLQQTHQHQQQQNWYFHPQGAPPTPIMVPHGTPQSLHPSIAAVHYAAAGSPPPQAVYWDPQMAYYS
ncbi:hypothetical protein HDU98_004949 [Podochytrium sp. JEL0797]|nr:hypothetical protein HDU98_004949 [Podochytrium sp. JEL0797]